MPGIAFFVSPHGFGHAARACAVMLALRQQDPRVPLEIFTRVPRWFFDDTLRGPFGYHEVLTDIGMAQRTPLHEDPVETLRRLQAFLPFGAELLDELARQLRALGCRAVVCDISPLGIAAARCAGLPSVLIENFTWDWIYSGYLADAPGLAGVIPYLQETFAAAAVHIQTEPLCVPAAQADLKAPPISRPPRTPRSQLRQQIGIPPEQPAILVTLGGIESYLTVGEKLAQATDLFFVVPGGSRKVQRLPNQLLLPHHSMFYHPDLLHACDVVVGKPGYSTLAEAYHAGLPFAYLPRPRFPEYPRLAAFIEKELGGLAIAEADFELGSWIDGVRALYAAHPRRPRPDQGSHPVAELIRSLV